MSLYYTLRTSRFFSSLPSKQKLLHDILLALQGVPKHPPQDVRDRIPALIDALYDAIPKGLPPSRYDETEDAYRTRIDPIIRAHTNYRRAYLAFCHVIGDIYETLAINSPQASGEAYLGTLRYIDLIKIREVVAAVKGHFFKDSVKDSGVFEDVRKHLNYDRLDASKEEYPRWQVRDLKKRLEPQDYPEREPPEKVVETFLQGTPLPMLFDSAIRVPYTPTLDDRFKHVHLWALPGHGKSQTLQRMIVQDLDAGAGVIVIDPEGDSDEGLIRPLSRLARFKDRLIVVDPEDSPQLGIFDVKFDRDDEHTINAVINQISSFCNYLFDADLSNTMKGVVNPLAHLMTKLPEPTLARFIEAVGDPSLFDSAEYGNPFEKLPPNVRNFLRINYPTSLVPKETKDAVQRRLFTIGLTTAVFDRMFGAAKNTVDVRKFLEEGKCILVNASNTTLISTELVSIFGRYFVARAFQAALQRRNDRPLFIYIDEGAMFLDKTIDDFVFRARKRNFGLVISHHDMDQVPPYLHAALKACAVQLDGTEQDTRKHQWSEWKAYDRDTLKTARIVRIPQLTLQREEKMSDHDYNEMRQASRKLLGAQPPLEAAPTPPVKKRKKRDW